jgi:hypothetical protein
LTNHGIHGNHQADPKEEADVMKMDFAFYRAVVMAVYGYKTLEDYNLNAEN